MRKFWVLLILVNLAGAANVLGSDTPETPDLITDRPDFTESGVVVPPGSIQLEAGFTFEEGPDSGSFFTGPEALIRWGISETLELRLGAPNFERIANGESQSGLGDASLGAKWQLGPVGAWDLAGILTTSVPTGADEFTSNAWDPQLILAAGRDLNERWSLGAQVSVESASAGDERETIGGATLVLGTALGETGRTGTFLEIAAILPESGTSPLVLHHGYTYLLEENLQLDLHGGFGLSETAPDMFVGAGVSYRR